MANTINIFGTHVTQMSESDLPMRPVVTIVLDNHSTIKDGTPIVGNNLMSDAEIDGMVTAIKADLDRVAALAKRQLKKARERTDKIAASHVGNRS